MNQKQELVAALQAIPWFQELSDEHFDLMCSITHLVSVDQDTTIFSETLRPGLRTGLHHHAPHCQCDRRPFNDHPPAAA